mgnify:CR=1 FL=1
MIGIARWRCGRTYPKQEYGREGEARRSRHAGRTTRRRKSGTLQGLAGGHCSLNGRKSMRCRVLMFHAMKAWTEGWRKRRRPSLTGVDDANRIGGRLVDPQHPAPQEIYPLAMNNAGSGPNCQSRFAGQALRCLHGGFILVIDSCRSEAFEAQRRRHAALSLGTHFDEHLDLGNVRIKIIPMQPKPLGATAAAGVNVLEMAQMQCRVRMRRKRDGDGGNGEKQAHEVRAACFPCRIGVIQSNFASWRLC